MPNAGRRVRVGRIVGVFGVHGEVKLESWTAPRQRIFDYQPWLLINAPGAPDKAVETEVCDIRGRAQGKGLVARLPDVDDRDAAAKLVGNEIVIARAQLPDSGEDEYYWIDLEGMEVVTAADVALGRVHHVFATGANDVLVVRGGERERLVPFVIGEYVKDVDRESGRIVVDWDPEF